MKKLLLPVLIFFSGSVSAQDNGFKVPPKEILDLADIDAPPAVTRDKYNKYLVIYQRSYYKTLEELASDELRLGGLRIDPANHDKSRQRYYSGIEFRDFKSNKEIKITGLPEKLRIAYPSFSPKSNYFSFVQVKENGLELWLIDLKKGEAKKLTEGVLSAVMGWPYIWRPNETYIIFRKRTQMQAYRAAKVMPDGPAIQVAKGSKAAARTYQDLLKNKQDEEVFDQFAMNTLEQVDVVTGGVGSFMPAAIYSSLSFSPDGMHLLTYEIRKPYSYQLPYYRFPYEVTVYDLDGKRERIIVTKPLLDKIPQGFDADEEGIRDVRWISNEPASLSFAIAQDEGDPAKEKEYRDHVFRWKTPFDQPEELICKTHNRYRGLEAGRNEWIVYDYWWKNRNAKTYIVGKDKKETKLLWDRSTEDLYGDPGGFVNDLNEKGWSELMYSADGKKLYLTGEGYGPQGNRPFLDEFDLATHKTNRLWQADGISTYESISDVISMKDKTLLTRIEGPTLYPNYYLRNFGSKSKPKQVTFIENPYEALAKVKKQKIHYKRNDGVDLSADLYLPPGYDPKKDGKLPVLLHAYPREFKDDKSAGMVKESPHRFVSVFWASPVYWAMRGYCILDNADFPIIGKGDEEPNDTFVEQLVANGEAAIKTVDSMGVGDPKRCAAMGHSYGAFMTANLLAHSDLFAAGIARSGAYNRTLTPFGFQAEERYFWDVPEVYAKMSPFFNAQKINEPLLLIHGDADNNPGTFTLQSERLFQAIKGLGGVARLVLLPYESHSYAARENILHMLWEMDTWLETYVKNKK